MIRRLGLPAKLASSLAAAALLTMLPQPACATVTFTWINTSGTASAEMDVTDAAYASGNWSANISMGADPSAVADQWKASGITRITFGSLNPLGAFVGYDISTYPKPCASCFINASFHLTADGQHLTGSIYNLANDSNNLSVSAATTSNGLSWITGFNESENPAAACRGHVDDPVACRLTGYWRLSTSAPASAVS